MIYASTLTLGPKTTQFSIIIQLYTYTDVQDYTGLQWYACI